ncbi:O-antigen ligase family protein [Alteromonas sp. a30]|uniref:O-antigen ligase family protein n=1 Tax=Alteromonas sp. a30 TaxID=2730917 RepID=UPI00227E5D38|nr:O-antigen ligase family protein [Alteromonas sp. a30]MCY7296204.1 O-antigen ligase family protein [Alteromonas sp. a30]
MTKAQFYRYSSVTILFCMFLTPTISIPGFIGIRFEELFIVPWLALSFLFRPSLRMLIPFRAFFFLLFSILLITSISVGSIMQLPASLLDLVKLIWIVKIFFIYSILYNFIHSDSDYYQRLIYILRIFVIFGFVSALICIQQYFDILSLNRYYVPIIAPTQFNTLMPGYSSPRVVGIIGNPNAQGLVMAFTLITLTYLILEKRIKYGSVLFVVLFSALIMTLSRSAFIVWGCGTVCLILLFRGGWKLTIYKYVLLASVIAIIGVMFVFLRDNKVIYNLILFRFELLANGLEEGSFSARFNQWMLNIRYFLESPIFGVGPLPRAGIFHFADNEWLVLLRSYGLVGTGWLVMTLTLPLLLFRPAHKWGKNLKSFNLSILLCAFMYMVPAAVLTGINTVSFLIVLLACIDQNHSAIVWSKSSRSRTNPALSES